jgi:hypothetical protein
MQKLRAVYWVILSMRQNDDKLSANEKLFSIPNNMVKVLDSDLQVAAIPKTDDRGRTLDLHALWHTFGTHLSMSGTTPRTAQAAMRHSSIDLTMNVYTDPRLLDVHGAIESLPALPISSTPFKVNSTALVNGTNDLRQNQFAPAFAPTTGKPSRKLTNLVNKDALHNKNKQVNEIDVTCFPDTTNKPLSHADNGLPNVERRGVEPPTFALRTRRSPS